MNGYNMATLGKGTTYVTAVPGPFIGPQPRLAKGTGRTGGKTGGTGAELPGYLSDNKYQISPFEYSPPMQESFELRLPRSIGIAQDGHMLVNGVKPYDSTPAQMFNHHMRSAPNWQQQSFPIAHRQLLERQQVQKYRVENLRRAARPLPKSDYFFGYQINPELSARLGQNTLGPYGG